MKRFIVFTLFLCGIGLTSKAQVCGGQIRNAGPCTVYGTVNYTNANGEQSKYPFTLCNNSTECKALNLTEMANSIEGGCNGIKDITVYYNPSNPVTITWGSPSTTTVISGACSPGTHMVQYMSISNDLAIY